MAPQASPLPLAVKLLAAKEQLLLWIMITTGVRQFKPGSAGNTPDTILNTIQADYIAKTGNNNWNWTNIGRPNARAIVDHAINGANNNATNYINVGADFQASIPSQQQATASSPWTTDGHDHPSVADLIDALQLS